MRETIEDNRQAEVEGASNPEESLWMRRARQLYRDSSDYYESSLYSNWRANIAHFRNEHAPGSKYTTAAYKNRSKAFRPKPRAAMRTLEATAAAALFTNDDLIHVAGVSENSQEQAEAGRLHQAILQHRLETSIPWFLTVLGAYQDTHVYGVCISRQHWDYRTRKTYTPAMDEMGNPLMDESGMMLGEESTKVISDKPAIDLIAPENFRFDPACDWRDPVNTSPYLIEVIPMYAGEVMNHPEFREYTLGEIVAHGTDDTSQAETVRDAREGKGRENSTEVSTANEYSIVWVHFNIIRDPDGEDWCFYTLGTSRLLTDPVPLEEYDPLGRARYTVGFSSIESHRSHPAGTIELVRPMTELINDTTNQRMDNVRLVLNKRYLVRRQANVDLGALMRNAPGGGVLVDDVMADIRTMDTPDVTSSSYAEQDRLAVESDELLGTFSQASVGNSRALNETVGGMNLMAQGANQVQELGLRCFIETWVEPVLRALVKLEGLYETDETILALAAEKAEVFHAIDDNLLMQDLVVRVNVGMGNTNPTQKLERFLMPLQAAAQWPEFVAELDMTEVGKEIFALTGQGDGSRFMLTDEKKQARAEAQQGQGDPRVMVEEIRAQLKQAELEQEGILKQMEIQSRQEIEMAKIAATQNITLEKLRTQLGLKEQESMTMRELEAMRDRTKRDIAALTNKYQQLRMSLKAENLRLGYDAFG
jgi:uncharacterized protein YqfB (UPF0267 family)